MKNIWNIWQPESERNTDILVQEALRAVTELGSKQELIALSGKKIKPS